MVSGLYVGFTNISVTAVSFTNISVTAVSFIGGHHSAWRKPPQQVTDKLQMYYIHIPMQFKIACFYVYCIYPWPPREFPSIQKN